MNFIRELQSYPTNMSKTTKIPECNYLKGKIAIIIALNCNCVTKLREKSKKSITFKNKKTGVAFIRPYVEPCFGCGNFSKFRPQLQLYYFDIAITNAKIIIAIFRLYLGFGTACVVGRPGPMSPNTAQARAGRPKHSLNCTSSLSCSK